MDSPEMEKFMSVGDPTAAQPCQKLLPSPAVLLGNEARSSPGTAGPGRGDQKDLELHFWGERGQGRPTSFSTHLVSEENRTGLSQK